MALINSSLAEGKIVDIFADKNTSYFSGWLEIKNKVEIFSIPFKAFGELAESCKLYLKKGSIIRIVGGLAPMYNTIGVVADQIEISRESLFHSV